MTLREYCSERLSGYGLETAELTLKGFKLRCWASKFTQGRTVVREAGRLPSITHPDQNRNWVASGVVVRGQKQLWLRSVNFHLNKDEKHQHLWIYPENGP